MGLLCSTSWYGVLVLVVCSYWYILLLLVRCAVTGTVCCYWYGVLLLVRCAVTSTACLLVVYSYWCMYSDWIEAVPLPFSG